VGYVVQQAAALCSQVRDLHAILDSDPKRPLRIAFRTGAVQELPLGDRP
jgi:hypothetical protein